MKNIALIFGGVSEEHDVSIITAKQIFLSLNEKEYECYPIYIDINNNWYYINDFYIKNFVDFNPKKFNKVSFIAGDRTLYRKRFASYKPLAKIDCCILATHGGNGEDGCLQGMLEMSNLPYTSGGVLSSALCMDKVAMKQVFVANDIKTPDFVYFNREVPTKKIIEIAVQQIEFPIVVKPARLGSSIGVTVCKDKKELTTAIDLAKLYDTKILLEKGITPLKEVNIAVMSQKGEPVVSQTEQPVPWSDFLSFDEKYLQGGKGKTKGMGGIKRKMPAEISVEQTSEIEKIAKKIYTVFDCGGIVRIDFLINDETQEVLVNEINSIPGSLAYYLWKDSFKSLLAKLVDESTGNRTQKKILFKSKILDNFID